MTGRERVLKTLRFEKVDRAPRDLWALPAVTLFQKDEFDAILEQYPLDIGASQISPGWNEETIENTRNVGSYKDDWGSIWQVGEPGLIGEVKEPVLADVSKLSSFQPPWHLIKEREADFVNKSCDESDQFILSDCTARPFERLQFLRGSQNTFLDIGYDTPELHKLLEMIHEYYLEDVKWWCKTNVDGVLLMDDWGSSLALLISLDTWRRLFKPLYKEYCDLIHAAGKFAFFHTDGKMDAIYGELIEVGLDAINSQLFIMDIEELAKKYKGKVTFWGELDRQHTLPFGTPEEVYESVRRVRRALDDGNGGVIAQFEWGKNNPAENVAAAFEAWNE